MQKEFLKIKGHLRFWSDVKDITLNPTCRWGQIFPERPYQGGVHRTLYLSAHFRHYRGTPEKTFPRISPRRVRLGCWLRHYLCKRVVSFLLDRQPENLSQIKWRVQTPRYSTCGLWMAAILPVSEGEFIEHHFWGHGRKLWNSFDFCKWKLFE